MAPKAMKAMKAYRVEPLYNAATVARFLLASCGSRCRACSLDLNIDAANMTLKGALPDSYIPDNWDEQIIDKQSVKRLNAAMRKADAARRKADAEKEKKQKTLRAKWLRNKQAKRKELRGKLGEIGYKALTSQVRQDARLQNNPGRDRQVVQQKDSSSDSDSNSSSS